MTKYHNYVLKGLIALMLVTLSACASEKKDTPEAGPEFAKVSDHLYEVVYTEDFNWSNATAPALPAFACSGVQRGVYRGRNYDWTYADTDICVIHATVTADRPHASVGVSDLSFCTLEDGY